MFNPDNDQILKTIVEFGDARYCEMRATELIKEAQISWNKFKEVMSAATIAVGEDKILIETYHEKMQQAISLLALARGLRANESD